MYDWIRHRTLSMFYYIEQVQEVYYELERKLWCREKYWKAQLFTLSHEMNSTRDWQTTDKKRDRNCRQLKLSLYFLLRMILVDILVFSEFLLPYKQTLFKVPTKNTDIDLVYLLPTLNNVWPHHKVE